MTDFSYTCYVIIEFTPRARADQWQILADGINTDDDFMFRWLRNHAVDANEIMAFQKFSRGTGMTAGATPDLDKFQFCLTGFEVSFANRDAVIAKLDEQAALRGITGNASTKFAGVMQAELQDVATALGYGPAIVAQLTVANLTFSQDRETARATARGWLTTDAAVWYP